jgi:transcriptional regulator with XRE-family HTH domain
MIPTRRSRRDASQWAAFGRLLADRREQLGLSRRHAARRAGISERAWKTLETGLGSTVGSVRLLPNPTDDELARIANALEVTKDALFGDLPNNSPGEGSVDRLTARIAMLSARDRGLVDDLVSRLLVDRR